MERIGRYEVRTELGRGAMGVVYEAFDPLMARTVAIKTIHPYALAGVNERSQMRDQLFKEARAAGALAHPGIVTAYDVGEHQDGAYIAMELVKGPSLQAVLASDGKLECARALDIVRQTAAVLDYAHQRGVIHRDIKPGNIMLQDGRVVKVADFGIAKNLASMHQTQSGIVAGTPSYMSPEQITAKKVDGRTDQYSLAVVAFEMLTHTRPFDGESLAALAYQIVHEPRPSARALNPLLSVAADRVLQRGLAQRPEDRYASCEEFANALSASLSDAPTERTVKPAIGMPRKLPLIAGGVLLTLLVGALLYLALATTTANLHADRGSVASGESTTLRWSTSGATAVEINPGIGTVAANGSISVKPAQATTYVLLATGPRGTAYAKAFVNVTGAVRPSPPLRPVPVTARFTADPESIEAGGTSTLRWDVRNASSVTIDHDIGKEPAGGAVKVKPDQPTVYTLTATGAQGAVTAKVSVNVTDKAPESTPVRVARFTADPESIEAGASSTLHWNVQGATSVAIDHGIGTVAANGTRRIEPDRLTTYTLTAVGTEGSATAKARVMVKDKPPEPRRVGDVRVNPKDGQTYVWITPGKFVMGCSPGDLECNEDEMPAHPVSITHGFWLGRTEVTEAAYARYRKSGAALNPELPVVNVSWNDAKSYCEWAGMRLPTEAEWEYAARSGTTGARYGAVNLVAWDRGNSGMKLHPVGGKQASAWGLYDMLGNAWEWVADWYGAYDREAAVNPAGPSSGKGRVLRGGSWFRYRKFLRASDRDWGVAVNRGGSIGFRCAGELR